MHLELHQPRESVRQRKAREKAAEATAAQLPPQAAPGSRKRKAAEALGPAAPRAQGPQRPQEGGAATPPPPERAPESGLQAAKAAMERANAAYAAALAAERAAKGLSSHTGGAPAPLRAPMSAAAMAVRVAEISARAATEARLQQRLMAAQYNAKVRLAAEQRLGMAHRTFSDWVAPPNRAHISVEAHELLLRGGGLPKKSPVLPMRLQDPEATAQELHACMVWRGVTGRTRDNYASAHRSFTAFCMAIGMASTPVHRSAVLLWLENKCAATGNATSVWQWATAVYGHQRIALHGDPFPEEDRVWLRQAYKGLKDTYGCVSKQPPALTAKFLQLIWQRVQPHPSRPQEWALWVHILYAYHCTMRPNEHLRKYSKCTVACATMLEELGQPVLRHYFPETKGTRTRKQQGGEHTFAKKLAELPGAPGTPHPLCIVSILPAYIARFELKETDPLFPCISPSGRSTGEFMGGLPFGMQLRQLMKKAGLEGAGFTARCLRSGHRTDLSDSGMAGEDVRRLGRWASQESAETYMRLTALGAQLRLPQFLPGCGPSEWAQTTR